jgi:hypothetical protein
MFQYLYTAFYLYILAFNISIIVYLRSRDFFINIDIWNYIINFYII